MPPADFQVPATTILLCRFFHSDDNFTWILNASFPSLISKRGDNCSVFHVVGGCSALRKRDSNPVFEMALTAVLPLRLSAALLFFYSSYTAPAHPGSKHSLALFQRECTIILSGLGAFTWEMCCVPPLFGNTKFHFQSCLFNNLSHLYAKAMQKQTHWLEHRKSMWGTFSLESGLKSQLLDWLYFCVCTHQLLLRLQLFSVFTNPTIFFLVI